MATAGIATARGKFDEGLRLCEQAIAHDPTCEEAYRQAMLCSYALGRQHEALHIFQRCSRALTQALGTGPMPETEELYRRILQDTPVQQLLPQALPSLRTIQTEHIDVPFLGRQPELTFLEDAWRTSEQGVLLVTVQGEAGIGKSRLVTEFLHKSELRCGRAKCTELERDLPFSGLAAALANLLTPLNAQDAERALMAGPAVVELLPELAGKASLTPAITLPPEATRIRLLESIVAVLRALAPLLLFLDDVQWVDASTVQALGRQKLPAQRASRRCNISERSPESISWAMTSLRLLPSTTARDRSPRCLRPTRSSRCSR